MIRHNGKFNFKYVEYVIGKTKKIALQIILCYI